MEKKQTAVFELLSVIPTGAEIKQFIFENDADEKMLDEWLWAKIYKAKDWKQMEREQMIDLVQSLKDYTYESDCVLGYDEREASEFVDIHYTQTFKP